MEDRALVLGPQITAVACGVGILELLGIIGGPIVGGVLIVVFLTSEGSPLLYAQEAENRFWTVVAMLLSSAVFFAEDSPLRIGNHSPVLGVTFVRRAASRDAATPRRERVARQAGRQAGSTRDVLP